MSIRHLCWAWRTVMRLLPKFRHKILDKSLPRALNNNYKTGHLISRSPLAYAGKFLDFDSQLLDSLRSDIA